jgi:TatA/E family protein of Tat protein translocase
MKDAISHRMGEFSITHWLIILAILLIFFGPSKLPQLGQSLGKAIRGFKDGLKEVESDPTADSKTENKPAEQISAPPADTSQTATKSETFSPQDIKPKNKV